MKLQKQETTIHFENAWLKGVSPGMGSVPLGSVGQVFIERVRKNEEGEGYFVDGRIELHYFVDWPMWTLIEELAHVDSLKEAWQS